jgi:hypothetical protein
MRCLAQNFDQSDRIFFLSDRGSRPFSSFRVQSSAPLLFLSVEGLIPFSAEIGICFDALFPLR